MIDDDDLRWESRTVDGEWHPEDPPYAVGKLVSYRALPHRVIDAGSQGARLAYEPVEPRATAEPVAWTSEKELEAVKEGACGSGLIAGRRVAHFNIALFRSAPEPVATFEMKHHGPGIDTADTLNALPRGHYAVFPVEVPDD